jgi:hypothetical protein
MLSKKGLICCPFVALVDFQEWFPRPNVGEVADVFSVPLSFLLNERNLQVRQYPGWTSFEWLYVRECDAKQFRIWGLSGAITLYLLVHAFRFAPAGVDLNGYFASRGARSFVGRKDK